MARRINLKHLPYDRSKIQVGLLVKLLQDNAEGRIELTQGRLKSIEILLKKAMPDLSAVEHAGTVDGPVRYYAELPRKDATPEAWSERVGEGTAARADAGADPSDTKH